MLTYIPDDPNAKIITQNFKNLVELDISHNMIQTSDGIKAAEKF